MLYPGYGQQINDQGEQGMFRQLGRRMPPDGIGPQQPVFPGQRQPLMAAPLALNTSVDPNPQVQLQPWSETKKNWGIGGAGTATPSVGGATAPIAADPGSISGTVADAGASGGGMMSKIGRFIGA